MVEETARSACLFACLLVCLLVGKSRLRNRTLGQKPAMVSRGFQMNGSGLGSSLNGLEGSESRRKRPNARNDPAGLMASKGLGGFSAGQT